MQCLDDVIGFPFGINTSHNTKVAIGELHNSSLLLDEVKSNLNGLLLDAVKQKSFKHLNFVEVNNVCDNGRELLEALRNNYL